MNVAKIDASQSAPGTDATTTLDARTSTLNQLIIANYATLTASAYAAYPDLIVWDCDKLIASLYHSLSRYGGPTEESALMKWADRFVTREALRYKITAEILAEHRPLIFTAIREALEGSTAREYYLDEELIFWEVALLIHDRAHSLARRGRAKLSTRLYALAKRHVWYAHTSYWNRRHRLNRERLQDGQSYGVETISTEERASMKADKWDSGYSELGLLHA